MYGALRCVVAPSFAVLDQDLRRHRPYSVVLGTEYLLTR